MSNLTQPLLRSEFQPLPSSIYRRVLRPWTAKIRDIFATIGTWFSSLCNRLENPLKQKEIVWLQENDHNLFDAFKRLQNRGCLGNAAINTYFEALQKEHPDFRISPRTNRGFSLPTKEELKDVSFLAIPVVVDTCPRDHIVVIVVDLKNNQIEYYDPKGLTSADRKGTRLLADPELDLPKLLNQIHALYGNEKTRLIENTKKHQNDSHNCGVYVSDYVTRRVMEESPEEIFKTRKSLSAANNSIRQDMIDKIIALAKTKLPQN